jgi:hypothetical protein
VMVLESDHSPTWGIAPLRLITDLTPGHIAERSCGEELLFLEVRLEVTSHVSTRALSSTNNSYRAARL